MSPAPDTADRRPALIVDFGGVLTTPVRDSFASFCVEEGIEPDDLRAVIREAYRGGGDDNAIVLLETGRLELTEFEARLAADLTTRCGIPISPAGLVERVIGRTQADERMIHAVRRARSSGHPTAMLSNSWGRTDYPEMVRDAFDVVVISATEGVRKPGLEIFRRCCERLGVEPEACVFVDDARPNCEAAASLGMEAILHRTTEETLPQLGALLGIDLDGASTPEP